MEEQGETKKKKRFLNLERVWGSISDFKEQANKEKVRSVLKGDLLHNEIITQNRGLIVLIMLLAFLYVGIRYYVEGDMKRISELQRELKDVRIESITRSSELIEISKRSAVVKTVKEKGVGLTESSEPPTLIK